MAEVSRRGTQLTIRNSEFGIRNWDPLRGDLIHRKRSPFPVRGEGNRGIRNNNTKRGDAAIFAASLFAGATFGRPLVRIHVPSPAVGAGALDSPPTRAVDP